ncbi:MAG TPA: tRNA (N(6)-L-threonylcarbamoyladenosine(37)-C(2))-methylthiotransferase MtaB [Rhodospirillaceae bacterium]|nr:MAG: tRNA (N(6)-L-threonylcarbamoyladenosine(37)-C(2))-methylthiotransferase MtaB [Alphaproteobacteria bacterium GWF2_58_20]HAU29412.1 tRNA (N(6)-L-threonylcarbamoyladenosine(37)-C(2))-methylthiotransferase MtaB [Rhodospirillaceae bacterium]
MKKQKTPGGVHVLTFGCRLNTYESEAMRQLAEKSGMGEVVIVNSCSVTAEAERQVRQGIRKARREYPEARIVVTGCAAELAPGRFAAMPEVDRVIGNARKLDVAAWQPVFHEEVVSGYKPLVVGMEGRRRAFVQVQEGCDHRCTYCIVPMARGKSRSFPVSEILREMQAVVGKGFLEVVLTGVDIASWGQDLLPSRDLAALVKTILAEIPGIARLRLSSLDPMAVSPELEALFMSEERLMPHVHLSIQSGDDMVLARMMRRHRRTDVLKLCQRLRAVRPDMAIGADLIAGFPTETDEMFENTLDLVKEAGLEFLHVFPYSERPGTPAARMPQVEKAVRRARAARLRALGMDVHARAMARMIGREVMVIVEAGMRGHAENFMPVRIHGECELGRLVRVRIEAVHEGMAEGRMTS